MAQGGQRMIGSGRDKDDDKGWSLLAETKVNPLLTRQGGRGDEDCRCL